VGAGGSQDAPYTLQAKVPAGTYHLEVDAVITLSIDVTFDLIWRHADGSPDTVLAEWSQHFDPRGGGNFDAQPFEYDEDTAAIDTIKGDQLVFRYTGTAGATAEAYIPNGDGHFSNGRIPNITLPR
jgi:hypothetical protein